MTSNDYRIELYAQPLFWIVCVSLLVFMTSTEIARFGRNHDSSSISFNKFNVSPKDIYPTFTICFEKYKRSNTSKNETTGASDNKMMKRRKTKNKKTKIKEKKIPNFNDLLTDTTNLRNMLTDYYTMDKTKNKTSKWELKEKGHPPSLSNPLITLTNNVDWPFYKSYHDWDKLCFTKNEKFKENFIKWMDVIRFHTVLLEEVGRRYIFVYVHQPNHLIRSFGEEVAQLEMTKESGDLSKSLKIKISGVNVIRKRPDAKEICNPDADDQDAYFSKVIIKKVGCTPPHWKLENDIYPRYVNCNSSKQLRKITKQSRILREKELNNGKGSPCTEMSISSSIDMKTNQSDLTLKFHYRTNHYFETVNQRSYRLEDLLASVGGYIGMFLGFGLLDVLYAFMKKIM